MDDDRLVSDLREAARFEDEYPVTAELHTQAADEITRLRAELAAERERNAAPSEYDLALMAERDALRALLREAQDAVWPLASQEHRSIWSISPAMMRALAAVYGRIDAALNKGGGDGG